MAISIVLTAYNMGSEATEADFDAWAKYVGEHVEEACGIKLESLDQYPFHSAHTAHDTDRVSGGGNEDNEAVRRWLANEGWEAFCADADAWPKREAS